MSRFFPVLGLLGLALLVVTLAPRVEAWTGGPDGCGYTGSDNLAPASSNPPPPALNFVDLTTSPTATPGANSASDDGIDLVALPFTFNYCGVNYSTVQLSSNGRLCLGSGACTTTLYTPAAIPSATNPSPAVFGYATDLCPTNCSPSSGVGTVRYETQGVAPNRVFIYMQKDVNLYSNYPKVTYEIKLFETTNCIEVQFGETFDSSGFRTVLTGIQASSTIGLQYSHSSPGPSYPSSGRAVKFCQTTTPPPVCAPATQTLAPGPASFTASSGVAPLSWSAPGGAPASQAPASPGNTFNTNYGAAGTYTVTVTDNAGNSGTCTVNVVVPGCGYTVTTGPAVYSWTEISATGTPMPGFFDYTAVNFPSGPAPFAFEFCGSTYTHMFPVSEGHICLGTSTSLPSTCSPCCPYSPGSNVPSTFVNRPAIFPYYSDLNPGACAGGSSSCMFYQTVGTAPYRVMIYEWKQVPYYFNSGALTFQAKLFETTNCIEVHYQNVAAGGGNNLAGYQNAGGGAAYTYSYGAGGFTASSTAWRACPLPPVSATARNDPHNVVAANTATHYQGLEDAVFSVNAAYPPAGTPFTGCDATKGLLCNDDHPSAGQTPQLVVDVPTLNTALLSGVLANVDATTNTLAKGAFRYTPDLHACGPKSFQYRAKDTSGILSQPATAYINVQCVHDPPVANPDAYTMVEGATMVVANFSACSSGTNVDLMCNDVDPDTNDADTVLTAGLKDTAGPKNYLELCTQATWGTVAFTMTGSPPRAHGGGFTYTPNAGAGINFYGTDIFTYRIRDGRTDAVVESACVPVTITITPVPDAPVALNDPCAGGSCPGGTQYRAYFNWTLLVKPGQGLLVNDYDVDNLPQSNEGLTVNCTGVCTVGPGNGVVTVEPNGAFGYEPPPFETACRTVTFQYRVVDAGGLQSGLATVSLYVCPRYPPIAVPFANPTQIVAGQSVSFSHASYTPGPDGAVHGVQWHFGDGFTSILDNPTHTFADPGIYSVRLTAVSHLGDHGDGYVQVIVNYPPDPTAAAQGLRPVADAGPDRVVRPGALVRLAASSPGFPGATFTWTQTAGPLVQLQGDTSPQVSFVAPAAPHGPVHVELAVVARVGEHFSAPDVVKITAQIPNEAPILRAPQVDAWPGQRVELDASRSFDPEGATLDFRWEQTAGEPVALSAPDTASPSFVVPLEAAGKTLVFLVEASDGRAVSKTTVEVRVGAAPGGGAPFLVQETEPGRITVHTKIPGFAHLWDYGDGNLGQGADAQHIYTTAGTYVIVLQTVQEDGSVKLFEETIVVEEVPLSASVSDKKASVGLVAVLALAAAVLVVRARRVR